MQLNYIPIDDIDHWIRTSILSNIQAWNELPGVRDMVDNIDFATSFKECNGKFLRPAAHVMACQNVKELVHFFKVSTD